MTKPHAASHAVNQTRNPASGQGSWLKTTAMVSGLAVAMLATNALAAWPRNPVAALAIGPISGGRQ